MASKKDPRPKVSPDKSRAKKARKVGIQDVPGGLGVKRRERSDDADSEGPGGTPPTSAATNSPVKKKNKTDRAARALECGVSLKEISKDEQDPDEVFEDEAVFVPSLRFDEALQAATPEPSPEAEPRTPGRRLSAVMIHNPVAVISNEPVADHTGSDPIVYSDDSESEALADTIGEETDGDSSESGLTPPGFQAGLDGNLVTRRTHFILQICNEFDRISRKLRRTKTTADSLRETVDGLVARLGKLEDKHEHDAA